MHHHRKPRAGRLARALRITAGIAGTAAAIGVIVVTARFQPCQPGPAPQRPAHALMGAIVRGQTIEIDGRTYVARLVRR